MPLASLLTPCRPCRLLLTTLFLLSCLTWASAGTHPRLLLDAEDLTELPSRAGLEPWRSMLEANERQLDNGDSYPWRPSTLAALYIHGWTGIDGTRSPEYWAEQARKRTLSLMADTGRWANVDYRSLSRGIDILHVANAFDLLYHTPVWADHTVQAQEVMLGSKTNPAGTFGEHVAPMPSQYVGLTMNEAVSLALKDNADSLIQSGGPGWPGNDKKGNNWHAVRYAGAAYGYLACDEPEVEWSGNFDTAVRRLRDYLHANLTDNPLSMGWNPEGFNYNLFPGWHTYPFAHAYQRLRGVDLTEDFPGMRYSLWTLYPAVLPIWTNDVRNPTADFRGLQPDISDDDPTNPAEGCRGLAYLFTPEEFHAGMKWIDRRLVGDLSDDGPAGRFPDPSLAEPEWWDSSAGNGLYMLLFYPADLPEENPASVWGLVYDDPTMGVFNFRSRYGSGDPLQRGDDSSFHGVDEDFIFFTTANLRSANGGHSGPDTMSFRISGLGVPWAVGGGRTSATEGQTTLFPSDPVIGVNWSKTFGETVVDQYLRRNTGDGYVIMNMLQSDTGVREQTRRMIVDYSGRAGVEGFYVISDSCADKRPWWRLNTLFDHTVDVSTPGTFVIESREGHKLVGEAWIEGGTEPQMRTGTVRRGSDFAYHADSYQDNRWVDFEAGDDGEVVVAMAVVRDGEEIPDIRISRDEVTATYTVTAATSTSPGRTVQLQGNRIDVEGWEPPSVTITSPTEGEGFNSSLGQNLGIEVSGTASDINGGRVRNIRVYLNDVFIGEETYDSDNVNWGPVTLPDLEVGHYEVKVVATDNALDEKTTTVDFKVTHSFPPVIAMGTPAPETTFYAGQDIEFSGPVSDGDGMGDIDRIEIEEIRYNGYRDLSDTISGVSFDAGTKQWRYVWKNVPSGRYEMTAVVYDKQGDVARAGPVEVRVGAWFQPGKYGNAANYWYAEDRETYKVVDLGGERVWRVQEGDKRNADNRYMGFRNRDYPGFDLTMRVRVEKQTDPAAFGIYFGDGLILDMRAIDSGMRGTEPDSGTRVHRTDNYHHIGVLETKTSWDDLAGEDPTSLHPGIPYLDDWFDVRVRRWGDQLSVEVNGTEIMAGADNWLATRGAIGLGFINNNDSRIYFDDVSIGYLDGTGSAVSDQAAVLTIDSPAVNSDLALTPTLSVSGTVSDPDGVASVEVWAGSAFLGEAMLSGSSWSIDWHPKGAGAYQLKARATDEEGFITWSEAHPLVLSATGGAGGNAAPSLTVLEPADGSNRPEGSLAFGGTAHDPEGRLAGVRVLRGDTLLGAANVENGEWQFNIRYQPAGNFDYSVIAFDHTGKESAVVHRSLTVEAHGPADTLGINFQPGGADVVNGYFLDTGAEYGLRPSGRVYGSLTGMPTEDVDSAESPSQSYDTVALLRTGTWAMELPNGNYAVRVMTGVPDIGNQSKRQLVYAQGQVVLDGLATSANPWVEGTLNVPVSDGILEVRGGTSDTQLCFLEITPIEGENLLPLANLTAPTDGSVYGTGVVEILLTAEATDDGTVEAVRFHIDGVVAHSDNNGTDGWQYAWQAPADGSYLLTVSAVDDEGATGFESGVVAITVGQPPVADIGADLTTGQVPLAVTFDGTGSHDPDGTITNYHWDFGDGSTPESGSGLSTVQHTFTSVGEFTVTLTVTDDQGSTDSATVLINPFTKGPQSEPMISWGNSGSPDTKFRGTTESLMYKDVNGDSVLDCVTLVPFSPSDPLTVSDASYTDVPVYGGLRGVTYSSTSNHYFNSKDIGSEFEVRYQHTSNALDIVLFLDKADFGQGGADHPVYFDSASSLHLWGVDKLENLADSLRWLVREGDQFYVSKQKIDIDPGESDETALTFASDDNDGEWAPYDPAAGIDFDNANAEFQSRNFSDITAFGILVDTDSPSEGNHRRWFRFTNLAMVAATAAPDPFGDWAAGYGLSGDLAEAGADGDGDRIPNSFEYLLGLSPVDADGPLAEILEMTATVNGSTNRFSYQRPAELPAGATIYYEVSDDLRSWTKVENHPSATLATSPPDPDGLVRDHVDIDTAGMGTMFVRMGVRIE